MAHPLFKGNGGPYGGFQNPTLTPLSKFSEINMKNLYTKSDRIQEEDEIEREGNPKC